MTTHETMRCRHCNREYQFQPSGHGCLEDINNETYCPNCMKVVLQVLEDVPQKIEFFMAPYDELTIEEVRELVAAQKKSDKGKLIFRRIAMCRYDMEDGSNQNVTGWITVDGKQIRYSYWTKMGEYDLHVEMERDLETGEERPRR